MKKVYQKATCKVRTIKLGNNIIAGSNLYGTDDDNSTKGKGRYPFMEEEELF